MLFLITTVCGSFLPPTIDSARSLAISLDLESRRSQNWREGGLGHSETQMSFYFQVAQAPWIKTICEVGFNVGHSAAVFLIANPSATVLSFDLGQYEYSIRNMQLLKEMFPLRFHYILGDSSISISQVFDIFPNFSGCDLVAVDGAHSENAVFGDLVNFQKITNCRNWVLADDTGFPQVNRAWQSAKDQNILFQTHCLADIQPHMHWMFFGKTEPRSWCLGWFNILDRCVPWFIGDGPNTNTTKCDVINFY